jgi:phosphoketolase
MSLYGPQSCEHIIAKPALLLRPFPREQVHQMNAYWRAANYQSVGQMVDMIYVCGPGHGGPGIVANTYLEGTYTELYPHIQQNEEGLRQLFKQFSFPGGNPSHAAPDTGLDS